MKGNRRCKKISDRRRFERNNCGSKNKERETPYVVLSILGAPANFIEPSTATNEILLYDGTDNFNTGLVATF